MRNIDIESEIRQVVQLYGKNAKGWESTICPCDHGKKGPRAAFMFTPSRITYNCFNCSKSAVLDLTQSKNLSVVFKDVLSDFGMSKKTIDEINFYLLRSNSANHGTADSKIAKPVSIIPKAITLPKDFVMLDEHKDTEVGQLALAELARRKINPDSYPFMICMEGSSKNRIAWEKRLVIPYFYNDIMVFYQAQDLTKTAMTKYLNAPDKIIDRSKIISNYDFLSEKTTAPIYIVEGFYDAFHLNGVAILGNAVKDHQQTWLNKSFREKVYIPDRSGDASKVAKWCLDNGWKVSVPYTSLESNIKDVSDIVAAYGKLYTMKLIRESTSTSHMDGMIKIAWLTK